MHRFEPPGNHPILRRVRTGGERSPDDARRVRRRRSRAARDGAPSGGTVRLVRAGVLPPFRPRGARRRLGSGRPSAERRSSCWRPTPARRSTGTTSSSSICRWADQAIGGSRSWTRLSMGSRDEKGMPHERRAHLPPGSARSGSAAPEPRVVARPAMRRRRMHHRDLHLQQVEVLLGPRARSLLRLQGSQEATRGRVGFGRFGGEARRQG